MAVMIHITRISFFSVFFSFESRHRFLHLVFRQGQLSPLLCDFQQFSRPGTPLAVRESAEAAIGDAALPTGCASTGLGAAFGFGNSSFGHIRTFAENTCDALLV